MRTRSESRVRRMISRVDAKDYLITRAVLKMVSQRMRAQITVLEAELSSKSGHEWKDTALWYIRECLNLSYVLDFNIAELVQVHLSLGEYVDRNLITVFEAEVIQKYNA